MNNFKIRCLSAIAVMTISVFSTVSARTWRIEDIHIRDPFVLTDSDAGQYYLYRSSDTITAAGERRGGVEVFTSKDLKEWNGPFRVMGIPGTNALSGSVWAPEVHEYDGKYFLFATINSDVKFKADKKNWPAFTHRGTQIFHSESPMGPFVPFSPYVTTPVDWMALDGTLWVEDGKPYMCFCHEWVQMIDGTMDVVELLPDLSAAASAPQILFYGSAPVWSTGSGAEDNPSYVTDGCFLYRTNTGKLLMIWSSFSNGDYAIGIAESVTGSVKGPWKQQDIPLFKENGGHGMIFKTLDGELCLILHQPNSPGGAERAKIYKLEDCGNTLKIK